MYIYAQVYVYMHIHVCMNVLGWVGVGGSRTQGGGKRREYHADAVVAGLPFRHRVPPRLT
jgi:hypothetical protein